MNNLNILIIEDDPIWLSRLQQMLTQLDIGPIRTATSLTQAQQSLQEQLPDLVIADIVLPDGLSFELFKSAYKPLVVIFQTVYTRDDFLIKMINMPSTNIGFLVKPFDLFALKATIDLVFARLLPIPLPVKKGLSIMSKHGQHIDLSFGKIYWIKGEGNYSIIHTADQKYVLKRSLRKIVIELPAYFVQVQKAYVINQNYIERIRQTSVQINQHQIPVGRAFRKQFLKGILVS